MVSLVALGSIEAQRNEMERTLTELASKPMDEACSSRRAGALGAEWRSRPGQRTHLSERDHSFRCPRR